MNVVAWFGGHGPLRQNALCETNAATDERLYRPCKPLKRNDYLSQLPGKLLTGPRYPGFQRADRAAAEGGSLFVGETAGADQHERFTRLRAQFPQHRRQFL